MSEPGERRRRRELERAAAEQEAAQGQSSRRAMREQTTGGSGVPSWSQPADEQPARSRRSSRDTTLDPTNAPRPAAGAQPPAAP
ncbi:hypothetical protein, partial [Cellulomonas algicola]